MFMGEGPRIMFEKLSTYGSMGAFIKTATKGHDWAQYFRVGDTPSVLYLIDPGNEIENPEKGSWAGKFKNLFQRNDQITGLTTMVTSSGIMQIPARPGEMWKKCMRIIKILCSYEDKACMMN